VITSERARVYELKINNNLISNIKRIQADDPETQRRKTAIEGKLKGQKGWGINSKRFVIF
jgi:hypothetical protein